MPRRTEPAFLLLCFLYFAAVTLSLTQASRNGKECLVCTAGVGLIEQLGQVHNKSISETLEVVCKLFHATEYRDACDKVIKFVGPLLINLFYFRYTPDVICMKLGLCEAAANGHTPKCHLFPDRVENRKQYLEFDEKVKQITGYDRLPPICKWPGARFFCDLLERVFHQHTPLFDADGDGFSTTETFRGSAWRGKDCNDFHSAFHPGAKPLNGDIESDSNCNGIYGVNQTTGEPFEKLFCEHSQPRGLMILGDSAGAHFHIPEQWLEARQLNSDILTHFAYVLTNEFDWPMMSFTTGFKNLTWPISDGYTVSVYDFLKRRNRCNHRDYHNFGVNGAGTGDPPSYLNSSIRSRTSDYPLLFFYEFVGNDVCNRHNDTLAHMTTPEQMRKNVLRTLKILDTILPNGSHVFMTGLANGSFLYEGLSTRVHPLGQLNQDIRYPEFYDFLSCVGENPCGGWMSTNATLRRITSERAQNLSDVLSQIAKEYEHEFKNFDLEYISCPLTSIVEDWIEKYGPEKIYQLIEPVDGFHPNLLANNLIAKHVWRYMEKHLPHFIGPINPHNEQIAAVFGDQGGY